MRFWVHKFLILTIFFLQGLFSSASAASEIGVENKVLDLLSEHSQYGDEVVDFYENLSDRKKRQVFYLYKAIVAAQRGQTYEDFSSNLWCADVPRYKINLRLADRMISTLKLDNSEDVIEGFALLEEARENSSSYLDRLGYRTFEGALEFVLRNPEHLRSCPRKGAKFKDSTGLNFKY